MVTIKEYLIFLAGNSDPITGKISEEIASILKNTFIESRSNKYPKIFEFEDHEGLCVVDMSQVVAVCINDVTEINHIGFGEEE